MSIKRTDDSAIRRRAMMSKKTFGLLVLMAVILQMWLLTGVPVNAVAALSEQTTSLATHRRSNAVYLKGQADRVLSSAGSKGLLHSHIKLAEPGSLVVPAQDDPPDYPGPEPSEENFDDFGYPSVRESRSYPADTLPSAAVPDIQNPEPTTDLAGMIYLWMAFIAAIVIFTAAVLGAILLYTRQQTKE